MKERGGPMILTAASIILLLLLLGYAKMASGSDGDKLLEGLTPVFQGPCHDLFGAQFLCVKFVKNGSWESYLVVLRETPLEVIVIIRVEGEVQTVIWREVEKT